MNTEIADTRDGGMGWVCYDADCPLCRRWAGRFEPMLNRHGFNLVPLQSTMVRAYLGLPEKRLLEEMRVVNREGAVFGGADAIVELAKSIPVLKPLYHLARLPGITPVLRAGYRVIARNRKCDGGTCRVGTQNERQRIWFSALPLLALTGIALIAGWQLPAWAYMWLICAGLFFGCKWLVFHQAFGNRKNPGVLKSLGFFLGWIGMDASAFSPDTEKAIKPRAGEWVFPIAKTLCGAGLIWIVVRMFYPANPLLAGWTGMVGLVLGLHFGTFELLALAWRKAGVNVTPLMRAPARAKTLAEFWGRRWNTGFHQLANAFVFRPARRALGGRGATWMVFALSGLLHDLVLSVPARGGYGLPTLYFLIQGAGVLTERSRFFERWVRGNAAVGWLFTTIVAAAPAFLLFHPPFIRNVMLPFLKVLNAI